MSMTCVSPSAKSKLSESEVNCPYHIIYNILKLKLIKAHSAIYVGYTEDLWRGFKTFVQAH